MTRSGADQMVIASAATTAGVYGYLRFRGQDTAPLQVFVTAWGVVYVGLALTSLVSPGLAAGFALLVMVGDLLANMEPIAAEIARAEGTAVKPSKGKTK